ncbi:hypothetical protein OH76DRAFT_1409386 [Lentinus brumalis]|uniref:beta-galactosidase n=1 Tax=Lentinus brumalis TaxID=2498619 RepID=A0A371CV37_9APHY|nr:hypothetical protein OH76DRAFT_1409386 [Polyporus brumalis]
MLVALLSLFFAFLWHSRAKVVTADPPRKTNGYTDVVTWDNYTLWIYNQRVFLTGGEFHTFRLPVQELWLDIFQKMVAAGLNHVSIYIHMGLTNPAPGVIDFDDWRAFKPIFDAATLAGIFVVWRPGPYINAETTAGGLSHWLTSEIAGTVRTNATDFTEAYIPYIDAIARESAPYQVTNGGPIVAVQIDNEYDQKPTHAEFFEHLQRQYRKGGIIVPLTYNDPNERESFINGTGAVDLYGMDAYPQRFDCSDPKTWYPVATNYHAYHTRVNPSQPWYMPEYQAGAYDPWGGPGYDACALLTGPDFEDVFYKHNYAANTKLISYYMLYGGTNWGGIAFPGVYTSYDYGSPIRETRQLSDKYDELKRQNMFIRSSPEFRKTDWIGDSSTGIPGVSISSADAFGTLLTNPDSGTNFLIVRQNDSTSTASIAFKVTIPTSEGSIMIPLTTDSIALDGRQSKIIVTDYHFGTHGWLLYATASIYFAGKIGDRDVVLLYGSSTQSHEFAFFLPPGARVSSDLSPYVQVSSTRGKGTASVLPGLVGLVTVVETNSLLILYADAVTAATFWAPPVRDETPNAIKGLETFWQFGTNTTVLVGGPYLVRNASISDGVLALRGDLNASAMLTVFAPSNIFAVTWNGELVDTMGHEGGMLQAYVVASAHLQDGIDLPELKDWKYADSLPEIKVDFDDSDWVVANKTSTNLNVKPLFGDGRVLYGCDYGYCENNVIWRGHFEATGSETAVNLTIYGGEFFAASVWINDQFAGTVYSRDEGANQLFTFPEGSVVAGQDNVVTVLQDNMGLDEDDNEKSTRGIAGFDLVGGGNFTIWRVQGKLGGYLSYPDKVRGLLNEGGLYGERQGWHLPGFDTSSWESRDLSEGLPGEGAGVGFFVTSFDLDLPAGMDIQLSFQFEPFNEQPYRALLFVNGWQYGKRAANVGPQTRFPVPQGILEYNGKNTVAIALWALENAEVSPMLQLSVDGVFDGGVGPIATVAPTYSEVRG